MDSSQPRSTQRTSAASCASDSVLASYDGWRALTTSPASGADNMALDHALVRRAADTGEAVLRVYGWSAPTLSLGRHQPTRDVYDTRLIQSLGVDVVRRPTGGRAVLHHREVTYSVAAPILDGGIAAARHRVRDVYAAVNQLLADALHSLGVQVSLAATGIRALTPGVGSPCFNDAAMGELVADERKLVGSAQWREGKALLQHGSILIDNDQFLLAQLAPSSAPARVATLRALLGRPPSLDEVSTALRRALDNALERASQPPSTPLDPDSVSRAFSALRAHYADPGWTWRL